MGCRGESRPLTPLLRPQEVAERDNRIHFLDCGAPFILPEGGLDGSILPDALHPNAGGMDLVASCLKPRLDSLISAHSAPAEHAGGL